LLPKEEYEALTPSEKLAYLAAAIRALTASPQVQAASKSDLPEDSSKEAGDDDKS